MKTFILMLLVIPVLSFAQENCKCCTEHHKAFDFWEGDWEVYSPDGNKAGENSIIKIQDNCILKENWKSANPNFTGTSFNYYNLKTSQWEQLWIDNQGQVLKLYGNRIDNQMILESEKFKDKDENDIYNRITWTKNADGTVRQLWESITILEEKEAINVIFDGLYKPKK